MQRPMYVNVSPSEYIISIPYVPILIDVIKRIPSKKYDHESRSWIIQKRDKDYVDKYIAWAKDKRLVSDVRLSQKERITEESLAYSIPEMPNLEGDSNLLIEPYVYQRQGIAYALKHKRVIMGDQPGLGKTLQAIGTLVNSGAYPALVICPASLKYNWMREFKKFAGVDCTILDDKNKDCWQNYWHMGITKVFIVNYESLKKFFVTDIKSHVRLTVNSFVMDKRINMFKSIVIDESHRCKSRKTQQSKITQAICRGKEYILALTGTPVVNNNEDLIQQLNILQRLEDFGGYKGFEERYCQGMTKSSNIKELNWKLWTCCFFRREKSKVLTQLPDKTRQYYQVEINTRKEYQKAEKDIIQYLRQYKDADDEKILRALRGEVMVKMQLLQNISARGKINAVSDFVQDLIDQGEKVILFANLKEVIGALKLRFPEAVTVTGSDNALSKQNAVDSFQNNESVKLIILNYRSGGVGLTLTASSNVLFIEFPWTYAECEQAEDRAHRNGQKNSVNCGYFLGVNTIDEYMYNKIQTKKRIADGVTGTDDQTAEQMVDMAFDMFGGKL